MTGNIKSASRIVIKVGSALLVDPGSGVRQRWLDSLCADIAALHAERLDHHPEWSNVYRTVCVQLTTHSSGGISALDFELAQKMESLAAVPD